jgi:hypothetical protein
MYNNLCQVLLHSPRQLTHHPQIQPKKFWRPPLPPTCFEPRACFELWPVSNVQNTTKRVWFLTTLTWYTKSLDAYKVHASVYNKHVKHRENQNRHYVRFLCCHKVTKCHNGFILLNIGIVLWRIVCLYLYLHRTHARFMRLGVSGCGTTTGLNLMRSYGEGSQYWFWPHPCYRQKRRTLPSYLCETAWTCETA